MYANNELRSRGERVSVRSFSFKNREKHRRESTLGKYSGGLFVIYITRVYSTFTSDYRVQTKFEDVENLTHPLSRARATLMAKEILLYASVGAQWGKAEECIPLFFFFFFFVLLCFSTRVSRPEGEHPECRCNARGKTTIAFPGTYVQKNDLSRSNKFRCSNDGC